MPLFPTAEPAAEPVTLAEAKAHLRLQHDSEDTLLSGLIRAARVEVERGTGTALIDQAWRLTLDRWPTSSVIELRCHPVRSIESVTVFDADGGGSVVDPAAYRLDNASRPARLLFRQRPAPGADLNGIEIDLTAGYGEAGADVPDLLKRAILLLVAHWFEFRTAFGPADQPVSWPAGYERLISGYRAMRLT